MDTLTLQIVVTVIAGILMIIGLLGIVLPVLPGSITALIGLLIWALVIGGWHGWVTFAIGAVLLATGMSASYVLTGKRLKAQKVPNRSILVGVIAAIIGAFAIPVLGLFIGFVLGLFACELLRLRELGPSVNSSWVAIKAIGVGIVIELSMALLAFGTWVVSMGLFFIWMAQ
ncbi:DUF456 domain-containing protein [Devriesea agamarum]|uniref:DUF456 domain-containing protein n=1 Tax=Devriesea agamarum TaxID=472569 RepID=UPI000AD465D7|nr:DUF456 domain-containing protein [Devriesea agamarum]